MEKASHLQAEKFGVSKLHGRSGNVPPVTFLGAAGSAAG
jgi:hypothetical protein